MYDKGENLRERDEKGTSCVEEEGEEKIFPEESRDFLGGVQRGGSDEG